MTKHVSNDNTESDANKVVVALDFDSESAARRFVDRVDPELCKLKIGQELFTRVGPMYVAELSELGYSVFLDLKYHDIPNTVAGACRAAAACGAWMINVHACGGRRMMSAAREALEDSAQRPLLIGVTVLTSLSNTDLSEIGIETDTQSQVLKLASLAEQSGLDGVVCSAQEAPMLRRQFGPDFLLVTPGIRLEQDAKNDQIRVTTPRDAIANGADYLVIGRSITSSPEPVETLRTIRAQLVHTNRD